MMPAPSFTVRGTTVVRMKVSSHGRKSSVTVDRNLTVIPMMTCFIYGRIYRRIRFMVHPSRFCVPRTVRRKEHAGISILYNKPTKIATVSGKISVSFIGQSTADLI